MAPHQLLLGSAWKYLKETGAMDRDLDKGMKNVYRKILRILMVHHQADNDIPGYDYLSGIPLRL